MRKLVPAVSVVLVLACTSLPAHAQKFFPAPSNGVPGTYMVVLERDKDGQALVSGLSVPDTAASLATNYTASVTSVWDHVVLGFVATMTAENAERMADDPDVAFVEQDTHFLAAEVLSAAANHCYFQWDSDPNTFPYNVNTRSLPTSPQAIVCTDPDPQNDTLPGAPQCIDNWGLDRVDQSSPPRDASYSFGANGTGVRVYMLDSGIWAPNREFTNSAGGSRVAPGFDAVIPPLGASDCYGHGSHTAGILGGRTFGVAKNVTLVPVRFVGCGLTDGSSQASWVVTGLNWIVGQHALGANGSEIVSWSGGNSFSWVNNPGFETLRLAVSDLARNPKLLLIQSAGNQNANSCLYSFGDETRFSDPELREAIARILVVGGSDEADNRWTDRFGDPYVPCSPCAGSNTGTCIDLFAPAAHVLSAAAHLDRASPAPPTGAYCQLSGTSMAAPHVAGAAALFLQNHRNASAADVKKYLVGIAAQNKLSQGTIGTSPNLLLNWRSNNPPIAVIQATCAGRTCHFDGTASLDDDQVVGYTWTLEGYGLAPKTASWDWTFPSAGNRLLSLSVADSSGLTHNSTITLQVP